MDYTKEKSELLKIQQIYATLTSLTKKLDKLEKNSFDGLTLRQCLVILAIRHSAKGEMSMSCIAKKLGTTKQNVNQMVSVLEKKGYVKRTICKNNKRSVQIIITETGMNAMLSCVETSASVIADIFSGLSGIEMELLLQLSRKLHCYDGKDYIGYINDIIQILESDYPDLLENILEEYKRKRK